MASLHRPPCRGVFSFSVGVRRAWLLGAALWALGGTAAAHGFQLGALRIDHPYATPAGEGVANGAVYLRGIKNTGAQPDRLLSASTPVAQSVALQRVETEGGVARMRPVEAIDLPAKTVVPLRHGGPWHLALVGLKRPLAVGERFAITLRFEHAGEREVTVWVQQPRGAAAHAH